MSLNKICRVLSTLASTAGAGWIRSYPASISLSASTTSSFGRNFWFAQLFYDVSPDSDGQRQRTCAPNISFSALPPTPHFTELSRTREPRSNLIRIPTQPVFPDVNAYSNSESFIAHIGVGCEDKLRYGEEKGVKKARFTIDGDSEDKENDAPFANFY